MEGMNAGMMKKNTRANEMWNIYGSFGYVNGPAQWEGSRAFTKRGSYYVCSEYAEDESGVISRKDKIKNISPNKISVSCLMSKFVLDGGEYEVYTQRNTWQNESRGAWQPVITGVSAETTGLRNAYGAAPFFAIWNQQTGRGAAFHIMTRQPWRFEVKSTAAPQESNSLEIEIGVNCSNFLAELEAGQELELPEILFYEIRNKLDMDCYKIHAYMNAHYPRRELPVIYNTWLYQFERINYENVKVQIPRAKELGVEYFVIDGGWFGNGNFWEYRGDWFEYETGAFHGRMADISRLVRENGMKFGFWLEIEAGGVKSEMMKAHRDYYLTYDDNGNELYFFDFSNPEACEYMFQTVSGLVKLYQAKFIKFDFNQDLKLDVHQKAFQDYFEGYDTFLKKLKTAHPDLYMENCASGGVENVTCQRHGF